MARHSGDLDRPATVDFTEAPTSRHAALVRALRSQGNEEEDRLLFFDAGGRNLAGQKAARGYAIRLHQHLNEALPESIRRLLKAHIRQMHAYTASARTIHPNEPADTWGLYNFDDQHIEVFGEGDHNPEATARHETGPALDHAMAAARNIDQNPGVRFKRDRRHAALSNTPAFQRLYAQYQRHLPRALSTASEEMFAEDFARYYGSPMQRAWLAEKAPDLYTYLADLESEVRRFVEEATAGS